MLGCIIQNIFEIMNSEGFYEPIPGHKHIGNIKQQGTGHNQSGFDYGSIFVRQGGESANHHEIDNDDVNDNGNFKFFKMFFYFIEIDIGCRKQDRTGDNHERILAKRSGKCRQVKNMHN